MKAAGKNNHTSEQSDEKAAPSNATRNRSTHGEQNIEDGGFWSDDQRRFSALIFASGLFSMRPWEGYQLDCQAIPRNELRVSTDVSLLGYAAYRSDHPAVASLNLLPEVCRDSSLRDRDFDAFVVCLGFGGDADMEM
jgi:hypothetical protein